eukprot:gb/GECG01014029.1/.p1 GENE.gb/GECG01014029.1/~~gb/GECG01014029.1/.p1  ORF type:complete len:570 (+),score=39.46 gb/GECG01014029.1/:1-1710(+)
MSRGRIVEEINVQDASYRRGARYQLPIPAGDDAAEEISGSVSSVETTRKSRRNSVSRRRRNSAAIPRGSRIDGEARNRQGICKIDDGTSDADGAAYTGSHTLWKRIARGLAAMLLPAGYPKTVRPGYARYQILDGVQGLCSYLRGILCTHAVLIGIGVGNENATAIAATLNWIARDGSSLLGSLAFSWWGGEKFGHDMKFWRLFADAINDVGLTLELLAPLVSGFNFLVVTCLASVCKSLCGVAAGCTKSTISQHFAISNNLADVSAKETAQENVVTLVGLLMGGLLANLLNTHSLAVWAIFIVLTLIHVYANYLAVLTLKLRTLNSNRIALLMNWWIKHCHETKAGTRVIKTRRSKLESESLCRELVAIASHGRSAMGYIFDALALSFMRIVRCNGMLFIDKVEKIQQPTADAVNDQEPILPGWIWGLRATLFIPTSRAIYGTFGASLQDVMTQCTHSYRKAASSYTSGEHEYALVVCQCTQHTYWVASMLDHSYSRNDILFPVLHMHATATLLHHMSDDVAEPLEELIERSYKMTTELEQHLMQSSSSGWSLEQTSVSDEGWRLSFK